MSKKDLATYLLVALLYYLGARFALAFTVMPEGAAILWPPNSVLLAALLLRRGRGFAPMALLALAAAVAAAVPTFSLTEALLFGLINITEVGFIDWVLRRSRFSARFATPADLGKFMLAGPVLASIAAAFLGAAVFSSFRGSETGYFEFWRIWWFGDGLGLLLFTPLLLSRRAGGEHTAPAPGPAWRWANALAVALAVVAMGVLAVSQDGLRGGAHLGPGMLLPFVIYAAARWDLRRVALTMVVMALFVVVLVTVGRQPFGPLPPRVNVIEAQKFIALMSVMGLGLAALLAEVRAQQNVLAAANQRLNLLNQDLEARVVERTAELSALNVTLTELAQTDALTGLLNRRAFLAKLQSEFERSRRHHHPLAVLMLDMDHFKVINDQYGHPAGDLVLQRTAALLAGVIRMSDTLARYGGEEFVLLAPETDLASAQFLAARVLQAVRGQAITLEQTTLRMTASIGLTLLDAAGEDMDRLLQRADAALYAAKAAGRNCIVGLEARAAGPAMAEPAPPTAAAT